MHTGSLKNGSWMMKSCDLRIDCDMMSYTFFHKCAKCNWMSMIWQIWNFQNKKNIVCNVLLYFQTISHLVMFLIKQIGIAFFRKLYFRGPVFYNFPPKTISKTSVLKISLVRIIILTFSSIFMNIILKNQSTKT